MAKKKNKKTTNKFPSLLTILAGILLLVGGFATYNNHTSPNNYLKTVTNKVINSNNQSTNVTSSQSEILTRLVSYTNQRSAGPTSNYYWENGKSRLSGFDGMNAGNYKFSADSLGRSSTARAILTYSEYQASRGSRQGAPLDPPAWPHNPKVSIHYGLNNRTYHGYLYNRSHSIADSLLGKGSYDSKYNFTTGTRPQNVGADQDGGMRYAEELAENYWVNHPSQTATIYYETTPLYNKNETVPRGSIVDIKSSDNIIDKEIVVINSVEGITIDYNNGNL